MTDEDVPTATLPSDERREATLRDCPVCGAGISVVSVLGPLEATAMPCGCRVSPAVLRGSPVGFDSRLGRDRD
ncbi:hypothetical protein EA462_10780 [Natrarchaeobius halalkaliphilus]|uniref:Small CPxCG-related zinc finger protein n=1 Tax=Natrarchaeobius halalkaliphilus TaxID=1679091 RepID=A0A3N6LPQ7_9EURY|nr:hypothetical protein [Natrarchaeobius halalkaliphilus]RQG88874.1 hypothetical protein EA462_10780 [Natrarchaeobius halalkaliphilus]